MDNLIENKIKNAYLKINILTFFTCIVIPNSLLYLQKYYFTDRYYKYIWIENIESQCNKPGMFNNDPSSNYMWSKSFYNNAFLEMGMVGTVFGLLYGFQYADKNGIQMKFLSGRIQQGAGIFKTGIQIFVAYGLQLGILKLKYLADFLVNFESYLYTKYDLFTFS